APGLVQRGVGPQELSRSHGQFPLPRAVRGRGLVLLADARNGWPRHRHRRRCAFDEEVGGMSWQSYPLTHMDGFAEVPQPMTHKISAAAYPRGHILHEFLEARVFLRIVGPVGRARLQYTAMWKAAQRMTNRPIKFGTILPELIAASVEDDY